MFQKPTALGFLSKFIEAFKETVGNFSSEELGQVWDSNWNGLIIGRPMRSPAPLDRPVWEMTAKNVGLKCRDGEPLRLDGMFVEGDHEQIRSFPIRVALEHEYVSPKGGMYPYRHNPGCPPQPKCGGRTCRSSSHRDMASLVAT